METSQPILDHPILTLSLSLSLSLLLLWASTAQYHYMTIPLSSILYDRMKDVFIPSSVFITPVNAIYIPLIF